MEYESLHEHECAEPLLDHFEGKYGIHTPKSRLTELIFGLTPFDRHDWTVDRCGKKVKYIIDYYASTTPEGDEEYSIDTRPAATLEGLYDRARVAYRKYKAGESWW